jgi:putative colanic acid biosynthesis acetyltransferase WcaF
MQLDIYENSKFDRGASRIKEILWLFCGGLLVTSWIPGSAWRINLLRLFGAQIGRGVVIKQKFRVTFPWRMVVGDYCWIGEGVWFDNLSEIRLGSHVCISQGAYLCTGSHDWSKQGFDLIVKPINIESQSWISAMSKVGPGVTIGEGVVLMLGSVATQTLLPWSVYGGNPATEIKKRSISNQGRV